MVDVGYLGVHANGIGKEVYADREFIVFVSEFFEESEMVIFEEVNAIDVEAWAIEQVVSCNDFCFFVDNGVGYFGVCKAFFGEKEGIEGDEVERRVKSGDDKGDGIGGYLVVRVDKPKPWGGSIVNAGVSSASEAFVFLADEFEV